MGELMIACVLHGKEDVRVEQRDVPQPAAGQVTIRVRRAGICGSDMEYFRHGYCGSFRPRRPFVLGHEFAGEVVELGEAVTGIQPGDRVTADPSHPCRHCRFCIAGRHNLCERMRFLGSASTDPHVDGAFCQFITMPAANCYRLPDQMGWGEAALTEPLAVAVHACLRAAPLAGKSLLVTGGGPIGQLVNLVARSFGAGPTALSDPLARPRRFALELGADFAFDPTAPGMEEQALEVGGGGFEVVLEASGSPAALAQAMRLVRRGGVVVQIGTLPDQMSLAANTLMTKEMDLRGSFRYGADFGVAVALLSQQRLPAAPLISAVMPLAEFPAAMSRALAKEESIKVQLEA